MPKSVLFFERETGRKRERDFLFHLLMYSLVASCMCPDWRLNLQIGPMGRTLEPTEPPGQGQSMCVFMH